MWPKCGEAFNSDSLMVWHLQNVHATNKGRIVIERFTCGQNGCERIFSTRVSIFKKHLKSNRHDLEQVPLADIESVSHPLQNRHTVITQLTTSSKS